MASRSEAVEFPPQRVPGRMPVLFVGHGSPMNGIEDNEFSRAWADAASRIPRPKSVLCVSAHWESDGTRAASAERPRTIHDFGGFPDELYRMQYPAPGSPDLARRVQELLGARTAALDPEWGLDHGAWIVLRRMFPAADIPVVQLSLDRGAALKDQYRLAARLKPLRDRGVLILCSGNMVHNLGVMQPGARPFDWAARFDLRLKNLVRARGDAALIDYAELGPDAALAIPTDEHYLPMLYALGATAKDEPIRFFAEKVVLGSVSMRCFQVG